jgi:HlyD family type I secretion membrane fusion protein
VVAPIDGTVVRLQVHTVGGVVAPGMPILDIVPGNDTLLIDARVDPKDRDVVRTGLPAEIRFTAFSRRSTAPVKGRVVSISADSLADERTGQPYYLARVELSEDPSVALGEGGVHPGMQADVLIVTGERTALSYLFRPIMRSLNRSLIED